MRRDEGGADGMVQLWGYRCLRCGHEWLPRKVGERPKVCARCKSVYYDVPRRQPKAEVAKGAVEKPARRKGR